MFSNLGLKVLAVGIAIFLWVVARGSSNIERGYDVPVTLEKVPEDLVVVERGANVVNLRVAGPLAALRNLDPQDLEYTIDVSGAKPGRADFDVDTSRFEADLPRGARIVSRSPSQIDLTFERRATRPVPVRADLEGQPAPGYRVVSVDIQPPRVRVSGARSQVLRLSEAVTEMIDVSGATSTIEREVRVSPGPGHMWTEQPRTAKVRVRIEPVPAPPAAEGEGGEGERAPAPAPARRG